MGVRALTIDEVCASLPNWIKLMIKDEKKAKEGLEKMSVKQDNMSWISCFAFMHLIGCPPFGLKLLTYWFL
jgi:dGTP triphosphohydrolase